MPEKILTSRSVLSHIVVTLLVNVLLFGLPTGARHSTVDTSHVVLPGHHVLGVGHQRKSRQLLDEWTVSVNGDEDYAKLLAMELGYECYGTVMNFPGVYSFRPRDHGIDRRGGTPQPRMDISADARFLWADRIYEIERVKRGYIDFEQESLTRIKRYQNISDKSEQRSDKKAESSENIYKTLEHSPYDNEQNTVQTQHGSKSHPDEKQLYKNDYEDEINRQNDVSEFTDSDFSVHFFNDQLWDLQWYLQGTSYHGELPELHLNVLPVYQMGINGSGIRIAVLDDGLEYKHADLIDNFDPEISYDVNSQSHDPSPREDENNTNSHGTRCAGEIAMIANNERCGVGVAWGARIGGIKLLDGRITDRVEGEAIGYAYDKVDIYSASWGPNDDGTTVEGPGRLAAEAILRGVTEGRGGKGVIYIWANGNGGLHYDNCNCDGYASSIYTVSIASASQYGLFPWYAEVCSSTLATTYSSGADKEQKVVTTDVGNKCTIGHTGTSAAAPLASGIIALALSANPSLTWRDVQHIIVWTSEHTPLSNNLGWIVNGAGLNYNIRFGFGLLNAASIVNAALNWPLVPRKITCSIRALDHRQARLSPSRSYRAVFYVSEDCEINYVEHVELIVSLNYTRRGAVHIALVSPSHTAVSLLTLRPNDVSDEGFNNWPFVSVASWGEQARGLWKALFIDETDEDNHGVVGNLTLIIHGTKDMPEHMENGPRGN